MAKQSYPRRVGEDTILRQGEQLIVCSKVDMDEWRVQENRRTAILIDEEVWCLTGKQYTELKEVHYYLDPWPDYMHRIPGKTIRYDYRYAMACKESDRKRKIENRAYPFLYPLRILIGFLPSFIKHRIEEHFGVSAREATIASILFELYLFFIVGTLLCIFSFVSPSSPILIFCLPLLIPLVIVMGFDLVLRYDNHLRENPDPLGFCEWLFGLHRTRFPKGIKK
jgi:hypothetical protein